MSSTDFIELKFVQGSSVSTNSFETGKILQTDSDTVASLVLHRYGVLTLAENTQMKILNSDEKNNILDVELIEGSLWVNTNNVATIVSVSTDNAIYTIDHAAISISNFDKNDEVIGVSHVVQGEFLNQNQYFSVSSGIEMSLKNGEVKIKNLINLLDENIDDQIGLRMKEDKTLKKKYETEVKSAFLALNGGFLQYLNYEFTELKKKFAILPIANNEYLSKNAHYLFSKAVDNDVFRNDLINFLTVNSKTSPDVVKKLLNQFETFFYANLPGSDEYKLKSAIADMNINFNSDSPILAKLYQQRNQLFEISDLMQKGDVYYAKMQFATYQQDMKTILNNVDLNNINDYIAEMVFQKQMLDDFYFIYFEFYNVEFLDVYTFLSDRILSIIQDSDLRVLYTHDFINENLRILTSLVLLIKEGVISPDDAILFGGKLLDQSKSMFDDLSIITLIDEDMRIYYEDKFKEFNLIFDFLISSEYKFTNENFEDAYKEYLAKQKDLSELERYLSSLSQNDQSSGMKRVNPVTIMQSIYSNFFDYGIEIKGLKAVGDNEYRLFSFDESVYRGIPFYGQYDYESQIVHDLTVDGKKIPAGVKLDHLADVILNVRFQDVDTTHSSSEEEEYQIEKRTFSTAELAAISIVMEDFDLDNFELAEENIFANIDNNTAYIKKVEFEYQGVVFELSFDYDISKKIVSNLMYKTDDGVENDLSVSFTNEEIEKQIIDDYEAILAYLKNKENQAPKVKTEEKSTPKVKP